MGERPVLVWYPGGELLAAVPSWSAAEEGVEGDFGPLSPPHPPSPARPSCLSDGGTITPHGYPDLCPRPIGRATHKARRHLERLASPRQAMRQMARSRTKSRR